ncbi:MAG: hypothetical protein K8R54_14190 [Bacteroidales bacterium]|nr:hypothetical protein [Bacteroidales bacterium]
MNKSKIRIFTEGYTDKMLLDILEIHPRYIEEIGSVSQLERKMNKELDKNYHKTIVGIADFDKGKSLEFFNEFELCSDPDNILLKKRPDYKQYIIFIKPKAIERWILDAAESVGIKPEDYKLPSEMKKFKKETKSINVSKNEKLIRFIRAIKKKEAEPFEYLQEILQKLLTENKYPCKTN